mgnify:CR=1 FL=1
MAVDFGTKRVGVAIADPLRLFAQPVGTFPPNEALDVLTRVGNEEGVDVVVIGWPLESDGSLGRMTKLVGEYINRIRKRLPEAEIVRRDERHTSERAKAAPASPSQRTPHMRFPAPARPTPPKPPV